MKHLGDITRLNGAEIEPVDVITGGSPCQDLSVAGKQAGLSGDRSGLFHEQMRLVREMREATGGVYPRFMVWENVPGALSTNKGADFREVLNECVKIVEEAAPYVPMPEKGGWPKAGVLYDEMERWSIAWRIHDAQFWGVPQRRRRIALVCDFRGMCAPEVLFEREGVRGDSAPCGAAGQEAAGSPGGRPEESDRIWDARGNGNGRLSATLTGDHDNRITDYTNVVVQKEIYSINGDAHGSGVSVMREVSHALKTTTKESVFVKQSSDDVALEPSNPCICIGNGQVNVATLVTKELAQPLNCMHDPMAILEPAIPLESHPVVVDRAAFNPGKKAQFDIKIEESEVVPSIVARGPHAVAQPVQYRVRRLTPLECTRLQGFPDNWVDIGDWTDTKGKKHKEADAPKYKALGNSIALPFWKWLLARIYAECEAESFDPALGSLFDGIGGFPLSWPGRTAWSSEIEEFPLAVLRARFGEE